MSGAQIIGFAAIASTQLLLVADGVRGAIAWMPFILAVIPLLSVRFRRSLQLASVCGILHAIFFWLAVASTDGDKILPVTPFKIGMTVGMLVTFILPWGVLLADLAATAIFCEFAGLDHNPTSLPGSSRTAPRSSSRPPRSRPSAAQVQLEARRSGARNEVGRGDEGDLRGGAAPDGRGLRRE
ncbi:hypothetical protein ACX4MT_18870 [Roseomonas mucosa]